MKYSKTKLNRSIASLRATAQEGITNAPNGDISKEIAEEIMIVLDRLSKLETMAAAVNPTFKFAGDNK